MPRIQIQIPPSVWERIQKIAQDQHRAPKQQMELFIHNAVREHDAAARELEEAGRER